jgi:DNA-binding response OmpR family regulator
MLLEYHAMNGRGVSCHALLIDHDRDARERIATVLATRDVRVTTCDEGRQGLAVALAGGHDIIVTDARLPGLDGYQLCQLLRRDAATCRTPIVVIIDEESEGALVRASRAGATAVLPKSCTPDAILAAIRVAGAAAPAAVAPARAAGEPRSLPAQSHRRPFMSRLFTRRATTTPPNKPPQLRCPECNRPLAYLRSHLGGVSQRQSEQWDDFDCRHGCGSFEFRHRTRRLRAVE